MLRGCIITKEGCSIGGRLLALFDTKKLLVDATILDLLIP